MPNYPDVCTPVSAFSASVASCKILVKLTCLKCLIDNDSAGKGTSRDCAMSMSGYNVNVSVKYQVPENCNMATEEINDRTAIVLGREHTVQ